MTSSDFVDEDLSSVRDKDILEFTTRIVSSYVGANAIPPDNVSTMLRDVYDALCDVTETKKNREHKPAVSINKSVKHDHIICLEDGKKFRSLKRHLRIQHDLSPDEYRERWNLPPDYPMAAPTYAKARSEAARKMGFGRGIRRRKKR